MRKLEKISRILCIGISGALLAGCLSSSPQSRYYALSSQPMNSVGGEILVGVGPIELPDYLNRQQIVIRGENERLIILEFDRWAEPFERGITRRIASRINQLNDNMWAYEFLRVAGASSEYRLVSQITRFEADQTNTVSLELTWGVAGREQLRTLKDIDVKYGYYTTEANAADIDAVTSAMGELLDQFSLDASAEIDRRLAADQALPAATE